MYIERGHSLLVGRAAGLGLCGIVLFVLSAGSAFAQQIGVTVNGQPVAFQGIGPQEVQGRVLVPVRGVLEQLGADVGWVPQTQTVVASSGNIDIQLIIGNRRATVNGQTVMLDVPAMTIGGHTMVPLRFLGQALGADVSWNAPTRTVAIVTNNTPGQSSASFHRHPEPGSEQPAAAPQVNDLNVNANGWLHAGEMLQVSMDGTPGAQASFRIPGLVETAPMQETSPGHYVGTWQVPEGRSVQLSNAAVIGQLKSGNQNSPLIQAAQKLSVDAVPPQVNDRGPTPNSSVTNARPSIYAAFSDQGSGVDPDSVHLIVNGQNVTGQAQVTPFFVSFTPSDPLPPGLQTVQLNLADKAGNTTKTDWRFTEEAQAAGGIKSVTSNADHPLGPGDVLHVEMTGPPGAKSAGFAIGNIQNVPMQESSPGRYVADYTIRKGDTTAGPPLHVSLRMPNGQIYVHQSEQAVQIEAGKPTTPVIIFPSSKDTITSPLVVRGKATPNTKVHVRIDYTSKVLDLLPIQGTATDVLVNADKNGNWQTDPINLGSLLANGNTQYTLSATGENANNEQSQTAVMKFRLH